MVIYGPVFQLKTTVSRSIRSKAPPTTLLKSSYKLMRTATLKIGRRPLKYPNVLWHTARQAV